MRKYIPRLAVALMALLCGRNIAVAQIYVAPDHISDNGGFVYSW